MLHLRLATDSEADFKIIRQLYEFDNQWLYNYGTSKKSDIETNSKKVSRKSLIEIAKTTAGEFGVDLMKILEEEGAEYSLKRFKRDLKEKKIFIIYDEEKPIGSIHVSYSGKGLYRIDEWGLYDHNRYLHGEIVNIVQETISFFKDNLSKRKKQRLVVTAELKSLPRMLLEHVGFKKCSKLRWEYDLN